MLKTSLLAASLIVLAGGCASNPPADAMKSTGEPRAGDSLRLLDPSVTVHP
jgi:hypothetical protein